MSPSLGPLPWARHPSWGSHSLLGFSSLRSLVKLYWDCLFVVTLAFSLTQGQHIVGAQYLALSWEARAPSYNCRVKGVKQWSPLKTPQRPRGPWQRDAWEPSSIAGGWVGVCSEPQSSNCALVLCSPFTYVEAAVGQGQDYRWLSIVYFKWVGSGGESD